MKSLKHSLAFIALAASMHTAGAHQSAPAHQATQAAPASDGIPVTRLSRLRVFSDEQTVNQQSKLQYDALLKEADQKNALVDDNHPQVQRLRAIAKRIIPHVARWNPEAAEWNWEVNLLNSDQVNAFCMPGGRIAFFTGILTKLNMTDDEVAMVMGHEIAHALREHARKRQGESQVAAIAGKLGGIAASALFGIDPNLTDFGGRMAAQAAVLKFSRGEETEADLVGIDLAARAGFDPRAGIALWRKMGAVNARAPIEFLSTHPSGETRIAEMNKSMPLVLPVYARTRGTTVAKLPAYRTTPLPKA
ncbi:M48 family metallopeptidase [Pseudoduganella umbonata]|uniref:M48 family metallopeptidase n=1 Tax=Pseudoduganella umbonata TaxID=864828 RepID=A0A4P8HX84_9BURK|nr:M48 family metallopeptidase [Pseudoduganella umbonata]MBB3224500.1 putative Zn-dependent protease [Pseudoduganella umbonata]QCP13270.1 M48 family metallopeptidase [Pseudoduganella umbonata]